MENLGVARRNETQNRQQVRYYSLPQPYTRDAIIAT